MKSPRAVVLGWGNARPSQLAAYEALYRSLGLEPLVLIPSVARGLLDPRAFARSLSPLVSDLAAEGGQRPLVFHLLSDNGFVGWAALLDALARTEGGRAAIGAVRGVVFDSSPGLWASRGVVDFAHRFGLGITPVFSRMLRLGTRERLPVVTPLLTAAFVAYALVFRASVRSMLGAIETVEREQPACPSLFLYGEQDVLVTPSDVRAYVSRQRGRGADVEAHAFPGARHVALLASDPARYSDLVRGFVTRVTRR